MLLNQLEIVNANLERANSHEFRDFADTGCTFCGPESSLTQQRSLFSPADAAEAQIKIDFGIDSRPITELVSKDNTSLHTI